jgi:MoxR-like ATPase
MSQPVPLLQISAGHQERLATLGTFPEQTHVFDADSIHAVNAALASRRPSLVRGEPGIGKSQLARATAKVLRRPYIEQVVDARTESRDLLWHYDAVARLSEAQLSGALSHRDEGARRRLAVRNYVRPGPLWWAFDWADATRQAADVGAPAPLLEADADPQHGCVLLIDEIDKAESEVPNGLLEALGNGRFSPLGRHRPVAAVDQAPLVIVTTNEERALPDAFLRRCWVLQLQLPDKRKALEAYLRDRGLAHFPELEKTDAAKKVLSEAIKLVAEQRVPEEGPPITGPLPLPGVAEFLDLLRAVTSMAPRSSKRQLAALGEIAKFALDKKLRDTP